MQRLLHLDATKIPMINRKTPPNDADKPVITYSRVPHEFDDPGSSLDLLPLLLRPDPMDEESESINCRIEQGNGAKVW